MSLRYRKPSVVRQCGSTRWPITFTPFFALGCTVALSTVVEQLKQAWSKWSKTQEPDLAGFAWQTGYGASSVSASNLAPVRRYIARQPAHHRVRTFEDEIRALLERHGVAFDERNVWD